MYYLKKKTKAKSDKPKTKKKPNLIAKLDKVFSAYIRLRDTMPNGYFVCISCGQIKKFEECDCGHFYSRKHMATRFDEDNSHGECRFCNRFSADHLIKYQVNLIRKIGVARFEKLAWKHNSAKHFTEWELQQMIEYYQREAKRLSSEKGIKITL